MKCNNCGAELQEGEKFCSVCGQQAESGGNTRQQASVSGREEKPKKSRGFKIGIVAAIVAVLVVGTVAGAKVISMFKKAAMSPAEYYQYVETNSRDNGEKLFLGYYDKFRENFSGDSFAKDIRMKLEASDTAKSLLSLAGVDVSNVKSLELNMVTGKEGKAYSNQMTLRGNDNDLLTVKTYMDLNDKKAYYQIPELSKSYLDISSMFDVEEAAGNDEDIDGSDDTDIDDTDEGVALLPYYSVGFLSLYDLDKILVETDDLKNLYERYTDLLIKSVKNVKKSEGGCEAEGVSQKADKYTITMDDEEFTGLAKELIQTLKDDTTLKGIIENIDKNAYEEYTSTLEDGLGSVDEASDTKLNAVMDVQIDSNDRIIGRKVTLSSKEDSGQKEVVIDMRFPKDGDNFGTVFAVEADGEEILNLHGKGTEKAGVINGEFVLEATDSLNESGNSLLSGGKLLIITMEDYDLSKYAEGRTSGTVTYATEAVTSLANYSMKIEAEGDMKESSGKISILAGKDALATIDFTMNSDAKLGQIKPSDSDTIYDINDSSDMLSYQKEMDIMKLLEDVQKKLDIDLSGMLAGLLTGGMSSNPLEDYEDLGELNPDGFSM